MPTIIFVQLRFPTGERSSTMSTVVRIITQLSKTKMERVSTADLIAWVSNINLDRIKYETTYMVYRYDLSRVQPHRFLSAPLG